jgi:DNA-binding beta-propeller fold protein YncE
MRNFARNQGLIALLAFVFVSDRAVAGASAPAKGSGYHVAKKINLPGSGTYYDYLHFDPIDRRLYISFGGQVVVFDPDRERVVGTLSGATKVHGIALALGKAFVTDGGTDLVRVYDPKTFKPLGEVTAGKNPDAIIYDPGSKQIFAFNNHGTDATVIDPGSLKVNGTIELGGGPEFARADGKGTVWVNLERQSKVVRIDSKKRIATAYWSLAPCEEPTGMAFDPRTRRLFLGCGNSMMAALDADAGKVVATVPIGPGVDASGFDPETKTIFHSCGGNDGSLAVIHEDGKDKYSLVAKVPTEKKARTMALDPKTHRVFLTTAAFSPPPAATTDNPKPKAAMVPGSFTLLILEPQ